MKCNIGLCWLSLSFPSPGWCGMIVVTNEVYVSICGPRRVLIYSYHYKNETELQSVQRVRKVNLVKEIKRCSNSSRRCIFFLSQQEAVFEGGGRQYAILLYFYPLYLACLSFDFNATLGPIGNWLGAYVPMTATEKHKDFLACGAQTNRLNSRN